jgi:hypothetical protein
MTSLKSPPSLAASQPMTSHTACNNNNQNLVSPSLTLPYQTLYYSHFHFLANVPQFLLDCFTNILCHFTDYCFIIIIILFISTFSFVKAIYALDSCSYFSVDISLSQHSSHSSTFLPSASLKPTCFVRVTQILNL